MKVETDEVYVSEPLAPVCAGSAGRARGHCSLYDVPPDSTANAEGLRPAARQL